MPPGLQRAGAHPSPARRPRDEQAGGLFSNYFGPEARKSWPKLLEKYAVDGELQFTLPDGAKVRPISDHGT